MNSLMNDLSSSEEISSTALDSPFSIKNSFCRARIFFSVFSLVFSSFFPSINSSTETISANLEVDQDDAIISLFSLVKVGRERRENRYDFFFTREDFRLRPVIGHTIIFTSEKIRPTNQIVVVFSRRYLFDKLCYSKSHYIYNKFVFPTALGRDNS